MPRSYPRTRSPIKRLAEDVQADLFLETRRFLADAGLPGYEVSNFVRGEHRRLLR